jgi:tetraprenyl-beta-curcumene synthase
LPGHQLARPTLLTETWRAQVLALNHKRDPASRDVALQQWAQINAPIEPRLTWYELSGAASASLTIHALLALAAQPHACSEPAIARVRDAYNPWISAATTMLDSYVDQSDDAANDDHSYIAHYSRPHDAAARLCWLIQQSITRARRLPGGDRHTVIVAGMVALYLSKDATGEANLGEDRQAIAQAAGPLARLLLPILHLWRTVYNQRVS